MPQATVIQASFNAGELSPLMDARADQDRYASGCRTLLNFVPNPQGAASNRPGFRFVAESGNHGSRPRLIDFVFNQDQAYVLEFGLDAGGLGYMRVFKDGGQVVIEDTDAAVANGNFDGGIAGWTDKSAGGSSAAGWNSSEQALDLVCDGTYAASAEQEIAHGSGGNTHAMSFSVLEGPVDLAIGTSSGAGDLLSNASYAAGRHVASFCPAASNSSFFVRFSNNASSTRTSTVDTVRLLDGEPYQIPTPFTLERQLREFKYFQSADTTYILHPDIPPHKLLRYGHSDWRLVEVEFGPQAVAPDNLGLARMGSAGSTTYRYKVTSVLDDTDEESLPTEPVESTSGAADLDDSDYYKLTWDEVEGAKYYNVYREKNGVYGYIGKGGELEFLDKGEKKPDTDNTPPNSKSPFAENRDYPACGTIYQQRTFWGRGMVIRTSQSANFENMNTSTPLKDDDACTYRIDSDKQNEIIWMAPGTHLYFGTIGGEYLLMGSESEAITPSSIKIERQTSHGSANVAPLLAGSTILFLQRPGNVVREFDYSLETDSFVSRDLSILAQHLTRDAKIVEWGYQQYPGSIVWCVLDSGNLIALSLNREHEIIGWHRHETDGHVESLATIPSDSDDEVWIVVRRKVDGQSKRYVEKLDPFFISTRPEDAFFVDSGLSYNDPKAITHISNEAPPAITCAAHGFSNGDQVRLTGITGMDELNGAVHTVSNAGADTFCLAGVDATGCGPYDSGGQARKCKQTFSGLSHLEGKTVSILADGSVHPQRTVAGGAITLAKPASHVHVGLPYTSDLVPSKPVPPAGDGTSQSRVKRVNHVWVRLYNTIGLKIGPDGDNLDTIPFRSDADPGGAPISLFTGDKKCEFPGDFDPDATVLIRQDQPLPITVVALVTQLETFDK